MNKLVQYPLKCDTLNVKPPSLLSHIEVCQSNWVKFWCRYGLFYFISEQIFENAIKKFITIKKYLVNNEI